MADLAGLFLKTIEDEKMKPEYEVIAEIIENVFKDCFDQDDPTGPIYRIGQEEIAEAALALIKAGYDKRDHRYNDLGSCR